MRSFRHALTGEVGEALRQALAARDIEERTMVADEWNAAVPMILLRVYTWLEDFEAVEREAAAACAMPSLAEPVKLVLVRGAQALAWFDTGRIAEAAAAARAADVAGEAAGVRAAPLHHRLPAGTALERRDLDTAEQLTERALSIAERGRPAFEFLALLDRAQIWPPAGRSATRSHPSRRPASSWPEPDPCSSPGPTS
jgi:LuxR family transcriptional regulator, maltose regulon positive regulatory protein